MHVQCAYVLYVYIGTRVVCTCVCCAIRDSAKSTGQSGAN